MKRKIETVKVEDDRSDEEKGSDDSCSSSDMMHIVVAEEDEKDAKSVKEEPVLAEAVKVTATVSTQRSHADARQSVICRADKSEMLFKRADFVVRFADLDSAKNQNAIWRVESHQMLNKWERVDENDRRRFRRTNKYSAWYCNEHSKFYRLPTATETGAHEVFIKEFPKRKKLQKLKQECDE